MFRTKTARLSACTVVLCVALLIVTSIAMAAQLRQDLVAWASTTTLVPGPGITSVSPTFADVGNGGARLSRSGNPALTLTGSVTGNGMPPNASTRNMYYVNNWGSGQYWLLDNLSTTGFDDITLSFTVYGSATGPRDFALEYSVSGGPWTPITTYSLAAADTYYEIGAGGALPISIGPLHLPIAVNDQSSLRIRMVNNSPTAINGNPTQNGGTSRIGEVILNGKPIADDGSDLLADWIIDAALANANNASPGSPPHFPATGGLYQPTSLWMGVVTDSGGLFQAENTSNTTTPAGNPLYREGLRYHGFKQGSFWLIEFESSEYENLQIDWRMRCSPKGPAQFQWEYSTDFDISDLAHANNYTWTAFGSQINLAADIPIRYPAAHFSVSIPQALSNLDHAYIRLKTVSNVSTDGTTVDTNGQFSVNFTSITGEKMPQLPLVVANPPTGSVIAAGSQITLSNAEAGATIHFSINGGPAQVYTGPITLNASDFVGDPATAIITSWATKDGWLASQVSTFTYTKMLQLPPVTAQPPTGTVIKAGSAVALADAEPGTTIYYSLNGANWQIYTGPITLPKSAFIGNPATATIHAYAVKDGWIDSETSTFTYGLDTSGDGGNGGNGQKPEIVPPTGDSASFIAPLLFVMGLASLRLSFKTRKHHAY